MGQSVTFGKIVQIREVQAVDLLNINSIKPKLEFKAEQIFFFSNFNSRTKNFNYLGLSCGFESHYKDEVLLNRRQGGNLI